MPCGVYRLPKFTLPVTKTKQKPKIIINLHGTWRQTVRVHLENLPFRLNSSILNLKNVNMIEYKELKTFDELIKPSCTIKKTPTYPNVSV